MAAPIKHKRTSCLAGRASWFVACQPPSKARKISRLNNHFSAFFVSEKVDMDSREEGAPRLTRRSTLPKASFTFSGAHCASFVLETKLKKGLTSTPTTGWFRRAPVTGTVPLPQNGSKIRSVSSQPVSRTARSTKDEAKPSLITYQQWRGNEKLVTAVEQLVSANSLNMMH